MMSSCFMAAAAAASVSLRLSCSLPIHHQTRAPCSNSHMLCCTSTTITTTASSSSTRSPIVVNGHPPTFVSAPGRKIVAGTIYKLCFSIVNTRLCLSWCFVIFSYIIQTYNVYWQGIGLKKLISECPENYNKYVM